MEEVVNKFFLAEIFLDVAFFQCLFTVFVCMHVFVFSKYRIKILSVLLVSIDLLVFIVHQIDLLLELLFQMFTEVYFRGCYNFSIRVLIPTSFLYFTIILTTSCSGQTVSKVFLFIQMLLQFSNWHITHSPRRFSMNVVSLYFAGHNQNRNIGDSAKISPLLNKSRVLEHFQMLKPI